MKYSFLIDYNFITYDISLKLDIRLQNVIKKLEIFFKKSKKKDYKKENIEFYLSGSCLKNDIFRDIDFFFFTKDDLNSMYRCIDKKYFVYENNSLSYKYNNDIFQLVYRERFLNKPLSFIVDVFDFHSTKIAFKCKLNTKTFNIEILEVDIRKDFISYLETNVNKLTKVNMNPFVSLQRAIYFLKRGDDVSFSVFLEIFSKISEMDKNKDLEEYFNRLQGDENTLKDIKEAITAFIKNKRN